MGFYEILLSIMEEKSLTIPDVARLTGLADSTIRSVISRKTKNVTLEVAFKISKGLNVNLELLNGGSKSYLTPKNEKSENLNKEEKILLSNFSKLNDIGKKEANKRVLELTELSKYVTIKEEYNFAAHDDGLDPEKAIERLNKAKEIFKQMDEKKK